MSKSRALVVAALACAMLLALGALVHFRSRTTASSPPSSPDSASPPSDVPPVVDDRAPEIRGHILDADGNAVEGATVRLVATSPPYAVYRDTSTGRDGAFSFAHVGPWRVRVVADHGVDGVVTSAVLQASAGQTTEVTLVLSAAGAVRGSVVDTQGHAVAGAVVSVEGVPWIVSATSDEAGAFRLTTVPDEATSLVAVARGFRSAHAALGPRSDQAELVVQVVLVAASPVDGEVHDDEGNPVSARVVACEDQPAEARAQSGGDGTFQLPPSAIGCAVIAEHAEYAPSDAAQVVEGRRVVLQLKTGGAIDGVVVDERGEGLAPFAVGVESFVPTRGRGFDRPGLKSFDDTRGAFHLDRLSPGTYVLTGSVPGRPPARSASIDVRGGAVTAGVRIVLAPGGVIVGHVYDQARAPIAGVDLHFDAVSRVADSKASAQTDGAGQYRLEGAPAGPLTMRVHKDGYRLKLVSGLRVESGATLVRDVTLVAPDGGGGGVELGGIGAGLARNGSGIVLQNVFDGDPASRAGLRAGDRIVRIDGEPTESMSMADALQRIRGEPGTSVGVTVERPQTGETVELTIERGSVVH